uniref:Uncharacterized protein n=1 Tax=Oryza punctata TaxID=4537 RepID=A0A0E0MKF0_ORYPU
MSGDGSGASGCGARWRLRMVVGGRDAVRSTTSDNFCRHLWRLCSGSATIARRPWMRVGRAAVAAAAANRFWRLRRRTSSLHTGDEPCSRSFKDPHLPENTSVKSYFQLTYLSMMVARVVLGTAPMTLSFFSPFLNMRTVGMLRMP